MRVLVEDDVVVAVEEAADRADVRHVAGGEDERRLPPVERGELVLELAVQVEGAVQQPGAGDTGAVLAGGPLRRLDDVGVVREAQVVVRPEVDVLVALDHEPGPRGALDGLVVGPVARRLGQSVVGEARECLEPPLEEAHPALTPPGSSLGSLPPARPRAPTTGKPYR